MASQAALSQIHGRCIMLGARGGKAPRGRAGVLAMGWVDWGTKHVAVPALAAATIINFVRNCRPHVGWPVALPHVGEANQFAKEQPFAIVM